MSVALREQIERCGVRNLLQAQLGGPGITLQVRTIGGPYGSSLRGTDGWHVRTSMAGQRVAARHGVIGHAEFQHDWFAIETIDGTMLRGMAAPLRALLGGACLVRSSHP